MTLKSTWAIGDTFTAADANAIAIAVNAVAQAGSLDARFTQRPPRSTIVAIGDSITQANSNGYVGRLGDMWLNHICVESKSRIRHAAYFGIPSQTLAQIQVSSLPTVLAMNPLPGACVIFGGTNDVGAGAGASFSLSTSAATLKAMVYSLRSVGVLPILVTIPPRNDSTVVNANVVKWNTWVTRFAALNNLPVIDAWSALVGQDGLYKDSTFHIGDGIHPSFIGHHAIATRALADGLAAWFAPTPISLTSKSTADLTSMFNNGTVNYGVHTTDTDADGAANGYTKNGTGTYSLVNSITADNLNGKWQQIARATGNTGNASLAGAAITTGFTVGDIIAFSARVQTEAIEASSAPFDLVAYCGGAAASDQYNGIYGWVSDILDGLVYKEFPVPNGTTGIQVYADIQQVGGTGTPKLRFGEVTIRNLTTGGLLV